MARTRGRQRYIEDYTAVTQAQLKKMADSDPECACTFAEAEFVEVFLPNGCMARVDLVRARTNLGQEQVLLVCPTCRRTCRTLRISPVGLACANDLKRIYKAKYKSQVRRNNHKDLSQVRRE
jgi:hypothetical protein